jgi:hypothetical protein
MKKWEMFSGHLWLTSYTAKLRKRSGSCHQSGRRRRDCSSPRSQRARYKIEALFAELKQQIKLRKVRLRRLWNVAEQFYLAATAQNLKRLVRHLAQKQSPALTRECSGKDRFSDGLSFEKDPNGAEPHSRLKDISYHRPDCSAENDALMPKLANT